MLEIPLKDIPNQELSVTINGYLYGIRLRYYAPLEDVEGIMFIRMKLGDSQEWRGSVRCLPNQLVMPYTYLTQGGNFLWICQDDEYPNYTKFGTLHKLVFLTNEEIEGIGIVQ